LALDIKKGNTGSFSRIKIGQKQLWIKSAIKILRSRAHCGGDEKPIAHAEPTKIVDYLFIMMSLLSDLFLFWCF